MPRLKKLSKIAKQDESNSYYSVNKYRIGEQDDEHSQLASRNKSKSNSDSSQQSVSDQQSQRTQEQSRQASVAINSKLDRRQSRQNKQIGKSTQKKTKNRHNADEILKKMQEQYANNEQDTKNGDDQQTNYHIPQDALVILSDNKKRKSKSKDKGNLKIKNKFFVDVICKDDIHQDTSQNKIQQDETEELRKLEQQYKIKHAAKMEKHAQLLNQRKSLIEGKANRLKDRLEFKNAHEDVRFKEHMRQTLDNVKDCEEVQIMIEAPKIFKGAGARQADAALYIKNLSQSHFTQTSQKQQSIDGKSLKQIKQIQDKNQKSRKIDRKQFYSQFTKQIKQIRAVEVPTQINGIFKKSSLDELENQLQNHSHLFREDSRQKNSISGSHMHRSQKSLDKVRRSSQVSRDKQKNEGESSNSISKLERLNSSLQKQKKNSEAKIEVVQQQKSHQQSKQTNNNQCKNNNQITIPTKNPTKLNSENSKNKVNSQLQQPKQTKQKQKQKEQKKEKRKKQRKGSEPHQHKRKSRRKNDKTFGKDIKELFQQEAEDSQNGYGDDGCSSQSGDDSSVDSMIDRKEIKFVAKNQREARKKFMEEEMRRDDEMLIKIKQKIAAPRRIKCQQSSQSRQRRKRRLEQARKNFEEQDGKVDQNFVNNNQNQTEAKQNPPQEQDLSKVLLNLQTEIAPTEKPEQKLQSRVVQPKAGKTKSVWQQMKIVNRCQTEGAKQKRGGFLNNTKSVGGNKIKATKKQKSKSKDKAIIF